MGLDMFLYGIIRVSDDKVKEIQSMFDINNIDINTSTLRVEVMYWRKANAIHQWFVHHIQNDNDNCGVYRVEKEELYRLYEYILTILNSYSIGRNQKETIELVMSLLPPSNGFFFGSTEIDREYFKTLEDTYKILEPLVKSSVFNYFEYESSW